MVRKVEFLVSAVREFMVQSKRRRERELKAKPPSGVAGFMFSRRFSGRLEVGMFFSCFL